MFCRPEFRRPKAETRKQAEIRIPRMPDSIGGCSAGVAINSDLGLRVSLGLRASGLEWPGPTLEQPRERRPLLLFAVTVQNSLPAESSPSPFRWTVERNDFLPMNHNGGGVAPSPRPSPPRMG